MMYMNIAKAPRVTLDATKDNLSLIFRQGALLGSTLGEKGMTVPVLRGDIVIKRTKQGVSLETYDKRKFSTDLSEGKFWAALRSVGKELNQETGAALLDALYKQGTMQEFRKRWGSGAVDKRNLGWHKQVASQQWQALKQIA